MIKEDLVAERIAIDSYREMINYVGNDDDHSQNVGRHSRYGREHADDLVSLLRKWPVSSSSIGVLWHAMISQATTALVQNTVVC